MEVQLGKLLVLQKVLDTLESSNLGQGGERTTPETHVEAGIEELGRSLGAAENGGLIELLEVSLIGSDGQEEGVELLKKIKRLLSEARSRLSLELRELLEVLGEFGLLVDLGGVVLSSSLGRILNGEFRANRRAKSQLKSINVEVNLLNGRTDNITNLATDLGQADQDSAKLLTNRTILINLIVDSVGSHQKRLVDDLDLLLAENIGKEERVDHGQTANIALLVESVDQGKSKAVGQLVHSVVLSNLVQNRGKLRNLEEGLCDSGRKLLSGAVLGNDAEGNETGAHRLGSPAMDKLVHEGRESVISKTALGSKNSDNHVAGNLETGGALHNHGITEDRGELLHEGVVVLDLDASPAGTVLVEQTIGGLNHDTTPERDETRVLHLVLARVECILGDGRKKLGAVCRLLNNGRTRGRGQRADVGVEETVLLGDVGGQDGQQGHKGRDGVVWEEGSDEGSGVELVDAEPADQPLDGFDGGHETQPAAAEVEEGLNVLVEGSVLSGGHLCPIGLLALLAP